MSKAEIDYYGLSDAEKRVAIAEDALKQLAAGRLVTDWQAGYFNIGNDSLSVLPPGDMRDALARMKTSSVCCSSAERSIV